MFDQQDYYSEEQDNLQLNNKHLANSRVLLPNSGSDFNHLTGEGESLLKMMQERGLDINENEVKKLKVNNFTKERDSKPKNKAGFLDGGASATYEQLLKLLNKALSSADPQQASVILSHILQKKTLSEADRNKFGVMKCKILFGIAAYRDCLSKAQSYLSKVNNNHLVSAIYSNYLAKCKAQQDIILEGYMDFLRAKAHLQAQKELETPKQQKIDEEFTQSEIDIATREIDHTEMEYNIKMAKYKNSTNLVHPYFGQLRHRQVKQVACGDYHTLFLVGGALNTNSGKTYEVMGLGQNTVGQLLGKPTKLIIKQPVVICELSGKGIVGIFASKQSSLGWDQKGSIYEWGIKEQRDQKISITYSLGEKISQLQKGSQHYAALTASGKFYMWGTINFKGSNLFKQAQPQQQPAQNICSISCGNSHVVAVDTYGDAFVIGSNEFGQLGLEGERHSKAFKKINSRFIGEMRKAVCIGDVTFLITREEQVYFTGRISYNHEPIERLRQGEFTGDIQSVTCIAGTLGNYYLTNQRGELYHWQVDSSVKFKIQRQNQKILQRYVSVSRGNLYKVRSQVVPQLTKVELISNDLRSYEDIDFSVQLFDQYGPYGNYNFVTALKCQIFFSTYPIKGDDLLKQNKTFLDSCQFSNDDSKILLNEIIESRLASFKIVRNQQKPWILNLTINSEQSGKFYFYVMIQDKNVFSKQLSISVSTRQKELYEKNRQEKLLKEEERRKKAQLERQRLLQEKLRRQAEEQQRRQQTQKRAEQSFKKYMKEQQQQKMRVQEQRRARRELMTGGGFDLSKIRSKNAEKAEIMQKSSELFKSTQSFLPDIKARPNSRRKINITNKNSTTLNGFEVPRTSQRAINKLVQDLGTTNTNLFRSETPKQLQKKISSTSKGSDSVNKVTNTTAYDSINKIASGTGGLSKIVMKRGLSRGSKK